MIFSIYEDSYIYTIARVVGAYSVYTRRGRCPTLINNGPGAFQLAALFFSPYDQDPV